jgi:hypothetical protein
MAILLLIAGTVALLLLLAVFVYATLTLAKQGSAAPTLLMLLCTISVAATGVPLVMGLVRAAGL